MKDKTIKPIRELSDVISTEQARAEFEGHVPGKPDEKPGIPEDNSEEFLDIGDVLLFSGSVDRFFYRNVLVAKNPNKSIIAPDEALIETTVNYSSGLFPSLAFTCNFLQSLYLMVTEKSNQEARKILRQYENEIGYIQNTKIDWGKGVINHSSINRFVSVDLTEKLKNKPRCRLGQAKDDPLIGEFVKNLTGLETPEILNQISRKMGYNHGVSIYIDPGAIENKKVCQVTLRPITGDLHAFAQSTPLVIEITPEVRGIYRTIKLPDHEK